MELKHLLLQEGGHITADTAATEEFNITHTVVTAGAWANGGNTAVGRRAAGGAGTQTAALFWRISINWNSW